MTRPDETNPGPLRSARPRADKASASSPAQQAADSGGVVEAIVRVNEDDYVPGCVTLRARIGARIFTATVDEQGLDALERDERVVSVEASRPLRSP